MRSLLVSSVRFGWALEHCDLWSKNPHGYLPSPQKGRTPRPNIATYSQCRALDMARSDLVEGPVQAPSGE